VLESMVLESINVGSVETISHGHKSHSTGICKYPVAGSVYLGELGISGDAVVDSAHHGGVDQAVYAYSADDYDWWAEECNREFTPGLFGENLTIRGLPSDMNVGDRLLIGEVVLEATSPRIPCGTLATKMRDTDFGLAFRRAERPGFYFRVLNSGDLTVGDVVTYVANHSNDVSMLELFRFNYALQHEVDELKRFLQAPIAIRFREKIERKLLPNG